MKEESLTIHKTAHRNSFSQSLLYIIMIYIFIFFIVIIFSIEVSCIKPDDFILYLVGIFHPTI